MTSAEVMLRQVRRLGHVDIALSRSRLDEPEDTWTYVLRLRRPYVPFTPPEWEGFTAVEAITRAYLANLRNLHNLDQQERA